MPRIIKNMADRFAKVKKAQLATNGKAPNDTLANIKKLVGQKFEGIEVGSGMVFDIPKDTTAMKHMAAIRGRLVAVTRAGEPWAGRAYQTTIDKTNEGKEEILVLRIADLAEPLPKKVGGRKAGTPNKSSGEAAKANIQAAMENKGNETPSVNSSSATPVVAGRATGKTNIKDLTAKAS